MKSGADGGSSPAVKPKPGRWGLFRRRECCLPTWRGWLLLGLILLAVAFIAVHRIYPFLAPQEPLPGGALIVEGWLTDDSLKRTLAEFQAHPYQILYVTGGPLEEGAFLSEYHTYAERGAAVLRSLGAKADAVQAVPAPPIQQDRTYTAAVALKRWCVEHGGLPAKVHLITGGPHARRSRLLYQKAMGPTVMVGVTSIPDKNVDPRHWWRSSAGFRGVVDESVAYFYARFLFRARGE
jgi:hypothetical protein